MKRNDEISGWPYSPTLIYDSFCGWPYAEPYGMVPPPKKKRVYKPRKKKGSYMSALTARPKRFPSTRAAQENKNGVGN